MNPIWIAGFHPEVIRTVPCFSLNPLTAARCCLVVGAAALLVTSTDVLADEELAVFIQVPREQEHASSTLPAYSTGAILPAGKKNETALSHVVPPSPFITATQTPKPVTGSISSAAYGVVELAEEKTIPLSLTRLSNSEKSPVMMVPNSKPERETDQQAPIAFEPPPEALAATIISPYDDELEPIKASLNQPLMPSKAELAQLLASLEPTAARPPFAESDLQTSQPVVNNNSLKDAYGQWFGPQENLLSDLEKLPPVPEHTLRRKMRDAVEIASRRSPSIGQAQAEWEASQYDVDEAKGQRFPQVQLGSTTKSWGAHEGMANKGGLNFNMTTTVYDFGYNNKNIESRKSLANAGEYHLASETEDNAYQVCTSLVELGKEKLILDINKVFVLRMQTLVGMLGDIVKVDTGRASELTQAQTRLLQAKAAEYSATARLHDIQINLRKLVGETIEPLPSALYWQIPVTELEQLLGSAKHSDAILQADAETKAAEAAALARQAANLPKLNWLVGKSTMEDALGNESRWQTSLGVSWNAFQGGSGRAAERAARARANASLHKKEQLLLDSENDLRRAHLDATTNYDRADQYKKLSHESAQVRRIFFEQWYHLGKRTLLDVLIAENDHNNNQIAEVTSQFDAYQAVLKMHASAGNLNQWLRQSQ